MTIVDLNTIHNPATGLVAPAAWGDGVRDNFEFLADPPAASVYNSGTQNVTNNTMTVLTANSENYDNDAMHSTVTNTSRLTVQTAGRWEFNAVVNFNGAGSGSPSTRLLEFFVNGITSYGAGQYPDAGTAATSQIMGGRTLTLVVGDYVEVRVRQQSGVTVAVTLNEFWALWRTR